MQWQVSQGLAQSHRAPPLWNITAEPMVQQRAVDSQSKGWFPTQLVILAGLTARGFTASCIWHSGRYAVLLLGNGAPAKHPSPLFLLVSLLLQPCLLLTQQVSLLSIKSWMR